MSDKTSSISFRFRHLAALSAVCMAIIILSCTSRYRMDLFMTLEEQRNRVKVERSHYLENSRLASPGELQQISPGDNTVVVIETGTRGKLLKTSTSNLFGYDEYLRSKLFIQIRQNPQPGQVRQRELSFVQVLGRFEIAPEDKLYIYDAGSLQIDSISSKNIYLSIEAVYLNGNSQALSLSGSFKVTKR